MDKPQSVEAIDFLIISAEASSNLYAVRILEELKKRGRSFHAFGVGNQDMMDLGFEAIGRAETMAVMGFQEVLSHYKEIKAVYDQILIRCKTNKPKFALLLDYPGFNLKLAEELKKLNIPVIYFIAPQVWAWKKKRVYKIKECIDKLLCIFPFEEDFYKKYGVNTEFVGHPLLEEIKEEYFDTNANQLLRSRFGISHAKKVIGLMPGSRVSEIKHIFKTQIETAKELVKKHPNTQVVVLVAPGVDEKYLKSLIPADAPSILFLKDKPFEMLRLVDMVLVASGTATLIAGLMKKPMVIMYKMNTLTALLLKPLVMNNTKYFGMINLIYDKELMPERFQSKANPQELRKLVEQRLYDDNKMNEVLGELDLLPKMLGNTGATQKVVDVLEGYF